MHITAKQSIKRLVLLVLTLAVILSSLSSCFLIPNKYVAAGKDEIRENIAVSLSDGEKNHSAVHEYLVGWGIPTFDRIKFSYFESIVVAYYNYEDAPETEAHAAALTYKFLDEYYDGLNLSDKAAVTDALLECYAATLGDPYAVYRVAEATESYDTDMSGKFGGIGVLIEYDHQKETLMVSQVYPNSPAEKAGVKVGDFIVGVDGKRVSEIGYLHAVDHVRGKIGTTVSITLLRGDREIEVSAVRGEVEEINVSYQSLDIDGLKLGYVQINSFKDNTFEQFKEAIDSLEAEGVAGIIFDMRNNLGGYVYSAADIISYMIPSGHKIVSYQYKNSLPTEFHSKDDGGEDHTIGVPIVVITNEYTASSAEIFTSAVRDFRDEGLLNARIVGTTTFKKGIVQGTLKYPVDNSTLTLTVSRYYPPSGVNFHGVGVAPDREVLLPEPVFDEATGKYLPVHDTQLDAALEEMKLLLNVN